MNDEYPITFFYIGVVVIFTVYSKIHEESDFLKLIRLDYKKVLRKYEIWRLISTFFYIGKLSPKLIIKFMIYYNRMKLTEKKFKKKKKLAEFIMMLIYLIIIIHICDFIGYYYFKIKINSFLSHQLMFSIILINSRREPNKYFRFYFAQIENKYVPYFLFSLKMAKNGDKIVNHIISFIPGLAYYWLKDVAPTYGVINNILITPKFLVDIIEKIFYKKMPKKRNLNTKNKNNKENTNIDNNKENTNNNNKENTNISNNI